MTLKTGLVEVLSRKLEHQRKVKELAIKRANELQRENDILKKKVKEMKKSLKIKLKGADNNN